MEMSLAQMGFFNGLVLFILFTGGSIILTTTYSYAQFQETQPVETQPVENPFQVIVTLFDVNQNTGDVITFVNSENITKWKIFTPFSELRSGNTAEVTLSFNGSNVRAGDKFKACVLMIKDISIVCKAGENSVAQRPEIVDISINEANKINAEPTGANTQVPDASNSVIINQETDITEGTNNNEENGEDGDMEENGIETKILEVKPSL